MNKIISITVVVAAILLLASQASAAPTWDKDPAAFEHGIALDIDGETWYFAGVPVGNGYDVPGHTWIQTGPNQVVGRHYNVGGPAPGVLWAPDEPDGVLLFKVKGIIAPPPEMLDDKYAAHIYKMGYVHFHELVNGDNEENEEMVVYLKHTAVRSFDLFGTLPVTPGIYDFVINWSPGPPPHEL